MLSKTTQQEVAMMHLSKSVMEVVDFCGGTLYVLVILAYFLRSIAKHQTPDFLLSHPLFRFLSVDIQYFVTYLSLMILLVFYWVISDFQTKQSIDPLFHATGTFMFVFFTFVVLMDIEIFAVIPGMKFLAIKKNNYLFISIMMFLFVIYFIVYMCLYKVSAKHVSGVIISFLFAAGYWVAAVRPSFLFKK